MDAVSDRTAPRLLAVDSGSPTVSVALAEGGRVVSRSVELARSSESLLRLVEEVLAEAEVELGQLSGIVALQGPGSFTGLRVGLATVLGLHQATALPATAVSTLTVLAASLASGERPIVAAVDALRGEWVAQPFEPGSPPRPLASPRRLPAADLCSLEPGQLVGFGVSALDLEGAALMPHEPPPLAPVAARLYVRTAPRWDPDSLTRPVYFRPPAVSPPRRRG